MYWINIHVDPYNKKKDSVCVLILVGFVYFSGISAESSALIR